MKYIDVLKERYGYKEEKNVSNDRNKYNEFNDQNYINIMNRFMKFYTSEIDNYELLGGNSNDEERSSIQMEYFHRELLLHKENKNYFNDIFTSKHDDDKFRYSVVDKKNNPVYYSESLISLLTLNLDNNHKIILCSKKLN